MKTNSEKIIISKWMDVCTFCLLLCCCDYVCIFDSLVGRKKNKKFTFHRWTQTNIQTHSHASSQSHAFRTWLWELYWVFTKLINYTCRLIVVAFPLIWDSWNRLLHTPKNSNEKNEEKRIWAKNQKNGKNKWKCDHFKFGNDTTNTCARKRWKFLCAATHS